MNSTRADMKKKAGEYVITGVSKEAQKELEWKKVVCQSSGHMETKSADGRMTFCIRCGLILYEEE